MRERWLGGWSFAEIKDPANKKSPYLTKWEDLTDDIRTYDIDAVKAIPRLLSDSGKWLCKWPNFASRDADSVRPK